MRDLDQLRERSDETMGRKLGLFALAGVLSVAATIAIGVVERDADERELAADLAPVEQLVRDNSDPKAPAPTRAASQVEPRQLSFPATLVGVESAVEATVRAAEAEHASLTAGTGLGLGGAGGRSGSRAPASTLASIGAERLQRIARHDPLVAQALPERGGQLAPYGAEGAFTLQVVAYPERDEAERFVNVLRARGHKAYVASGEVPGRSRTFRVRIGPFASRREAVEYQGKFERTERMHTLVVSSAPQSH